MKILSTLFVVAAAALFSGTTQAAAVLPNSAAVNNVLSDRISEALSRAPETRDLYIQVDAWDGLAIMHGWALNKWQRRAAEKIVRGIEGVDAVFNYMTTDDDYATVDQLAREGRRIQITMSNMNERITDLGVYTDVSNWPVTEVTSNRETSPVLPKVPIVQALPNRVGQVVKYRLD